ncbi:enoyl-CoA hydratase/isomerase family protein [Pseudonocardia xishanensis]|uniref:Enoyl-CoA hydratase/isomerase family protein n=1 Tax=Pseudonocardia xishanensis TaxID=630995 RepID=A0ABP8RT92_9PSEU
MPDQTADPAGPPRVTTDLTAGVATVTLVNPGRGNALTRPMYEQLNEAWTWVEKDPAVRVVVFTSTGERHFCTGADVSALGGALRTPGERFTLTWRQAGVTKPVVVAVNGLVGGGGLGFVTDGDIVVASRNATFMDPHVSIGQICGYGALRLVSIVGQSEATRLALAGGRLDAERAHTLGLVNELWATPAEALARAVELARAIVKASPAAVALTHRLLRGVATTTEQEGALTAANPAWDEYFHHPDATEGVAAFTEKRAPRWAEQSS